MVDLTSVSYRLCIRKSYMNDNYIILNSTQVDDNYD